MGYLSRALNKTQEQRSNIDTILKAAMQSYYGTASGASVTPSNSIRNTAVLGCVRILAETVASLPLIVYERAGRSKKRARSHYLYEILHDQPNDKMTSFEYRETLQGHLALWGNAYSHIDYDARGRVTALWPLRPDRMVDDDTRDGVRWYYYQLPSNDLVWIPEDRIWHLKGLGSDGSRGYSIIQLIRQSVGLGLAAESYGSSFFGNGARPGGVLEHPGTLTQDAYDRMKKSWNEAHQGLEHAQKVAILEEGVKYTQVGVPPNDAQFLDTRKFQVTEIARAFRIPPHMLADLDRATFSNIEHQSINFVTHTMTPWLVRWEQSIYKNLFLSADRHIYFVEFLVEGLLRGDTQSRYEAYSIGRQNGWLSANDIRALENMNPIPGGDVYLVPLNMIAAPKGQDNAEESGAPGNHNHRAMEPLEERQIRSLASRRRIMFAQLPVLQDTLARIYRREINDVGAAAKKMILQRAANPEFLSWLNEFYLQHRGWIADQVRAVFLSYAEMMAGEAAAEVGAEIQPEAIENFVNKYAVSFAERQAANSQESILQMLAAEETQEDMYQALQDEFINWREIRPERTAHDEMVQQAGAVTKFAYGLGGVVALRWVTYNKSCPYCTKLNNVVIGIKQSFLNKGAEYEPEGAPSPLRPTVNVGHPPAHGGCDCMIVSA